jgi:hypothetical protein
MRILLYIPHFGWGSGLISSMPSDTFYIANKLMPGENRGGDLCVLNEYWSWWRSIKPELAVDQSGDIYVSDIGVPKGSFAGQVKKIVSDEVMAYYKYGGDVDIYNLQGEYTKTIKATPFPFDNPATHYKWITEKNIREYGVGKYKELPINVKEYKGYVYSATAKEWEYTEFKPDVLYDTEGKVLAQLKGAVRFGSGKGVSEGFLRISRSLEESGVGKPVTSPTIYANYLKDV